MFGHTVTHRQKGNVDPFYAHFVEFGTKFRDEDSYIAPALFLSRGAVVAESRKAIAKAVDEIARKAKK